MADSFDVKVAFGVLKSAAKRWFGDTRAATTALTLGSGLGGMADRIERATRVPFRDVPGLPSTTAAGHRGEFVLGWLGKTRVIAMAGRLHAYEGHSINELTRPMRIMLEMNPQAVIVSCAAGGLNPRYDVGDISLIDQHIGMLHGRLGGGPFPVMNDDAGDFSGPAIAFRCGRPTCDRELAEIAAAVQRRLGFRLQHGSYLAVTGPTYETRAECRMMRNWGADLVGMSTVPELVLASRRGLRTLGIAVVTNLALPDAPVSANHAEVLDVSGKAEGYLEAIVVEIAGRMSAES